VNGNIRSPGKAGICLHGTRNDRHVGQLDVPIVARDLKISTNRRGRGATAHDGSITRKQNRTLVVRSRRHMNDAIGILGQRILNRGAGARDIQAVIWRVVTSDCDVSIRDRGRMNRYQVPSSCSVRHRVVDDSISRRGDDAVETSRRRRSGNWINQESERD